MNDFKVLFSEEEIQEKIKEIAKKLDDDFNGKEIVAICVLKGAAFFTVDLVKKMKTPIIFETMQVSSYEGLESTGNVVLKKDIELDIENKDVLIVEDIIDTGRTLKFLYDYLKTKNPNSLKIVTLLDKEERRMVKIKPDYCGYKIPNKFVVGYGFDIDEKYRNIPYIGYVE